MTVYVHPPHLTIHTFRARSVFVSVMYVHIKKKMYCKELIHAVMEAETPTICRLQAEPRKAVVSFGPSPKA